MSLSSAFLAGLGTGAGLIVAIGAQNAFVLRQGLQRHHVGVVIAICVLSDVALILAGVSGMSLVISGLPWLLQLLRVAGAVFLVAYGFLAAKRAWRGGPGLAPAQTEPATIGRVLIACLAFTWLNPHVYLDTVVLLGSLSTAYAGAGRWMFAAGASTASLSWFLALGLGARWFWPMFRRPYAWRVLDGAIALLMWVLAALLLIRPMR